MEHKPPVRIAPSLLDAATLRSVLEEFVTRDGTEHSEVEAKVDAVQRLLEAGEVSLWYDPDTGSCNIVSN